MRSFSFIELALNTWDVSSQASREVKTFKRIQTLCFTLVISILNINNQNVAREAGIITNTRIQI